MPKSAKAKKIAVRPAKVKAKKHVVRPAKVKAKKHKKPSGLNVVNRSPLERNEADALVKAIGSFCVAFAQSYTRTK